jgi:hypothetical protein
MQDPQTEELRVREDKHETLERKAAEKSLTEDERLKHARRAEKAAYLRERLEDREAAEAEDGN